MKRPDINDYADDVSYIFMLDEYATDLEHENDLLVAYQDREKEDDNSPESEGGLTLTDEDNLFGDGTTGEEWPGYEVTESDETRRAVMNYILDRINERFAELRELVDDEST